MCILMMQMEIFRFSGKSTVAFFKQLINYQILIIASSSTRVKHLSGSNFCNVKICSFALSVMSVNEESLSAEPSVETKDAILRRHFVPWEVVRSIFWLFLTSDRGKN